MIKDEVKRLLLSIYREVDIKIYSPKNDCYQYLFCREANIVDPDQTSPIGAV